LTEEFRALGLDVGDARIGVAVSDPTGCIAQPIEVVQRVGPRKDLQRIARRARELGVAVVVVGLPLLPSGEEGEQAAKSREFAAGLARHLHGVRIETRDERLTTVEAERTMIAGGARRRRRKQAVDSVAAALILQGYLDTRAGAGD
jgi:putative Holliday junction resolvase